jgi:hypothetical protein
MQAALESGVRKILESIEIPTPPGGRVQQDKHTAQCVCWGLGPLQFLQRDQRKLIASRLLARKPAGDGSGWGLNSGSLRAVQRHREGSPLEFKGEYPTPAPTPPNLAGLGLLT